tara:strand:+ start:416 stop:919 length:504 start_codon:yes stop_codon:yes gene_type:complete
MTNIENKLVECKDSDIKCFNLDNRDFVAKITNVYDADTCKVVFFLNDELVKFTLRLMGIDTPEIRPKKTIENRDNVILSAKRARNRLIQLATNCEIYINLDVSKKKIQNILDKNSKIIKIKCYSFDKYGRLLADIYVSDESSKSIAVTDKLISEGHGYSYNGGTKKL